MATVISYFYNEEYLLPWWIKHHTSLFDHGILINRASTDRSIEICRSLAPHWEIIDSRSGNWLNPPVIDGEMMEIEQSIKGWKIVLNTTEFLCCRDMNINKLIEDLESKGSDMYKISGYAMVDQFPLNHEKPDYNFPLVLQKYHGILPHEWPYSRHRFIHKYPTGSYYPGRHTTTYSYIDYPLENAFIQWFGLSPWNDALRKRRLRIQPNPIELDQMHADWSRVTKDLRLCPNYRRMFESWVFKMY